MSKIVCYGEVLWDVFPSHKKIGGAPLNVALRLSAFNNDVSMISSVGNDADGEALLDYIESGGLHGDGIQINNQFKTGEVNIILDDKGAASYTINFPCAWDYIGLTDDLISIVTTAEAFIFGSLASRNQVSMDTLLVLLDAANFKVFDLNLRAPHYTMEILDALMLKADFIKFNDEELFYICEQLGCRSDAIEQQIKCVSKATHTKTVCVTLGAKGALLFINDRFYKNKGYSVEVRDTVGAGDSFLAAIIHKLLHNHPPQDALDFACAIGAIVASKSGANPKITEQELNEWIS